jgi:hypothetical protein
MRPFVIVVFHPFFGQVAYFSKVTKDVCIKNRPAITAVKALDITILSRTPGLGIEYVDSISYTPVDKGL